MERLTTDPNGSRSGSPVKALNPPQFRIDRIREQILVYLASAPRKLAQLGSEHAGDLALDLGNCLVWIAAHLEDRATHRYQKPDQTPVTVFALGSQLQEVGRDLIAKPKVSDNFHDRLDRIEQILHANLTANTARDQMPQGHPDRDEVFSREEAA